MIEYHFIIKDPDGNSLVELANSRNRRFSRLLNGAGEASFVITFSDDQFTSTILAPRRNNLNIYRGEVTGSNLVWSGEIVTWEGMIDGKSEDVTIVAKEWLEMLSQRLTGASREFSTPTDAGQIAWTLINESQSKTDGDFGITEGTIQPSVNRVRLYEYKNIKEAIEELSRDILDNGFDFEITPLKVFNVYYLLKCTDRTDTCVFELGSNINQVRAINDFGQITNQVIALGKGQGPAMITSTQTDATLRGVYKLRQRLESFKDEEDQDNLDDRAAEVLDTFKSPFMKLELVQQPETIPILTDYVLGDLVRARIKYGNLNIDNVFRVKSFDVQISDGGAETVRIGIDSVL